MEQRITSLLLPAPEAELEAERYPKTRWYKEECRNSADEFRQAIFACKTFEEVADILMPERKTSVWQRIEEYFIDIIPAYPDGYQKQKIDTVSQNT